MYIIAAVKRVLVRRCLARHFWAVQARQMARCPSGGGVARALGMCGQPGVKQPCEIHHRASSLEPIFYFAPSHFADHQQHLQQHSTELQFCCFFVVGSQTSRAATTLCTPRLSPSQQSHHNCMMVQ